MHINHVFICIFFLFRFVFPIGICYSNVKNSSRKYKLLSSAVIQEIAAIENSFYSNVHSISNVVIWPQTSNVYKGINLIDNNVNYFSKIVLFVECKYKLFKLTIQFNNYVDIKKFEQEKYVN